MPDPVLDWVLFTGQRRPSGWQTPFPLPNSDSPPPWYTDLAERDPHAPRYAPCTNPAQRKNFNMDAFAATTFEELADIAGTQPTDGPHGFEYREYGAVLWELPNGSLVHGPVTWGTNTFQNPGPGGVASVALDWTPPVSGALPYGTVHTHGPGGHVASGNPSQPNNGDLGVLNYVRTLRGSARANDARIYIGAMTLGQTQEFQINVYDHRNMPSAMSYNTPGPEVNPNGRPCP
jgi:hypothetical protein